MVIAGTQSLNIVTLRTANVNNCPLCSEQVFSELFSASDRLHGTPGVFHYNQCEACSTVFQSPRIIPDDIALCYPSNYFTHVQPIDRNDDLINPLNSIHELSSLRNLLRQAVVSSVKGIPIDGKIGWIGKILSTSRFIRERAFYDYVVDELLPRQVGTLPALDIGCGTGELMIRLQRVGWDVEGVEWDPHAALVARNRSNGRVWEGDFRQIRLPQNHYRLVVLSHVIEHLDDPIGALARIKDLLAPGGYAVLFYPNPKALGRFLFKSNWFPWEVPRHLVFPSLLAVKKAIITVRLVPLKVKTISRHSAWFFAQSRAYLKGYGINGTSIKLTIQDYLLEALDRALVYLGFSYGTEILAVFKKPE